MVGSVFGKRRANGLRHDLDAGLRQDVEDREVSHTVTDKPLAAKDKSLEEMASDLRSLSRLVPMPTSLRSAAGSALRPGPRDGPSAVPTP